MIRFGALCSPALRIHTLAPVSFPLTIGAVVVMLIVSVDPYLALLQVGLL
ncbi:hypothetical protein [Rhodococcus erythropolis]|nr:hypothetical protein [Rhodococcus erythropolis]